MDVSENGVSVVALIDVVKRSIKAAGISSTNSSRDMRVSSVDLDLNVLATEQGGVDLDFRIPFIGMRLKFGGAVTKKDTHTIHLSMVPPAATGPELRDTDIEAILADAIRVIRATISTAEEGDDPFFLSGSTIQVSFAITDKGNITLGVDGSFANEVTHTLTLGLKPVG